MGSTDLELAENRLSLRFSVAGRVRFGGSLTRTVRHDRLDERVAALTQQRAQFGRDVILQRNHNHNIAALQAGSNLPLTLFFSRISRHEYATACA